MSKTDPKDDEQKLKFFGWLDEWWDAKAEILKEEKKTNPKAKGFLSAFFEE